MKIYIGADHAGYDLKKDLREYLTSLGHYVEDKGAYERVLTDDYPDYMKPVAEAVAVDPENSRGIIIGGSGQGEAMVANRVRGVRAAVFYGDTSRTQTDLSGKMIDIITSTREHNDANVLSLGARFLTVDEAKKAVKLWLDTPFTKDERHIRRIKEIDA